MVPREGVEPSLPKEPDFESGASANSAIWASKIQIYERVHFCKLESYSMFILNAFSLG